MNAIPDVKNQLLRVKEIGFGVNEKLLSQHISGPVTNYKLLYVSNRARAWAMVRARAKG